MSIVLFIIVSFYGICGLLFVVPFVLVGVNQIDPHAGHASWGFRLLIIPGTVALQTCTPATHTPRPCVPAGPE